MFEGIRKDVLKPLKKNGIDSIIYGGYVRDTILDKSWKDIDLVIHRRDLDTAEDFFGVQLNNHTAKFTDYGLKGQNHIVNVYDFKYKNWPINLIAVTYNCNKITNFENTIDLGICVCAITDSEEYFSKSFYQDAEDKQITLLRETPTTQKAVNHWLRIYHKYPWPLRPHKRMIKTERKSIY